MAGSETFDQYSARYDEWFEEHPEFYHAELAAVRQLIPAAGAEGLEVGVGTGRFAVPLGIGIGVDPSAGMGARARKRGIRVVRAAAEALPFTGCVFDFVLMVTTICFVDDIGRSFGEAHRVLKPGGSIVVGFVDKESGLGREYEAKCGASVFYREATFLASREVCGYLAAAGFGALTFRQTLLGGAPPGLIETGFGRGGFVVVKGIRQGG